jgi:endonuclease/exonuclease/phosphatase family metal-dependent hydrolase
VAGSSGQSADTKSFFELPIRLLSHNIRYATGSPFRGEETWAVRAPRLINELRFHTLYNPESFICLQEVLNNQLVDILSGLNSDSSIEWAHVGVGRENGKTAGEYSPIIYRPNVWTLVDCKTIWLSETPDQPSKGWDAASTRILTVAKFQHIQSGKVLIALNTHLDDQGSQSRLESAKIIAQQAQDAAPLPVFLAGDFNSEPGQEAYSTLSAENSPVCDLRDQTPTTARYAHQYTYTGFGYEGEPKKRIDFLFLSKGGDWQAKDYAVLESRFEDGVYNSDHRAVVGDVLLRVKS